jgi:signal transduction histidine kinase
MSVPLHLPLVVDSVGTGYQSVPWLEFFANTGLGLVVLGPDLAVQSLNPMAEQLTGWSAADAVGQDGRTVVVIRSPRHLRLRGLLNRVRAGQAYPCQGEPGQLARLVTRDHTERSVGLQVLAAAPDAPVLLVLQELPHRRLNPHCARDFLAAAGHELRTPLTALRGFADVLVKKPDLPPETRAEFNGIIAGEVARLSQLVDSVLEMSRLEVGAVLPKLGTVAPGAVLEAVLVRYRRLVAQKQIQLAVDLTPNLAELWTDQSRLLRIMEELISNAVKFTPAGGTVKISLNLTEQHLCFVVQDTGPGIPPGDEQRIFDQFYRGKSAVNGAGLGLSLVRGNVELLGGMVSAATAATGGARFEVLLPWEELLPD